MQLLCCIDHCIGELQPVGVVLAGRCKEMEIFGLELPSEHRFFEDTDDGRVVKGQIRLEALLRGRITGCELRGGDGTHGRLINREDVTVILQKIVDDVLDLIVGQQSKPKKARSILLRKALESSPGEIDAIQGLPKH